METLGRPFLIQNTKEYGWIVTWNDAITVRDQVGDLVESVSFTAALPRQATLTIEEVQQFAVMRAIELLQRLIRKPG